MFTLKSAQKRSDASSHDAVKTDPRPCAGVFVCGVRRFRTVKRFRTGAGSFSDLHHGKTSLSAFLTPGVLRILVEQFGIQPIGDAHADLAAVLERKAA